MRAPLYLIGLLALTAGVVSNSHRPISISGAWSRPALVTGVVYATLHNDGSVADRLVEATTPVASNVGLHESFTTKLRDSPTNGGMDMPGMPMRQSMIGMRSLSFIAVPAHGTVTLKPGGYHVMLDLRHPIRTGDTIPIRWHFAHAGWILTKLVVAPN